MHHRAKDITGLRVGYLTAIRYHGTDGKHSLWAFRCECGTEKVLVASEMQKQAKRGVRASCGCMRGVTIGANSTKHGMSAHPAYGVWRSMMDRCALPTHQAWRNYGARGIGVCDRWRASFENFWADMGETYQPGLTLDRTDNAKGYGPENCRWADYKTQMRNTRNNRMLSTPLGEMPLWQAVELTGIGQTTLLYRANNNWPAKDMFRPPNLKPRSLTSSIVALAPGS